MNYYALATVAFGRLPCWVLLLALVACLGFGQQVAAQPAARGFNPDFGRDDTPQIPQYNDPLFTPIGPQVNVLEVRFEGNRQISDSLMATNVHTRAGRLYDPQMVQADVRRLIATRNFSDVRTTQQETPQGIIITFQVVERGLIQEIRFVGNEGASERQLRKEVGLTVGEALDSFSVEEGRRRIEEYYHRAGYSMAHVSVAEGLNPGDRGICYMIDEGPKQRIRWTAFVGNDFVTDSRLRTQIESKPGYFWLFQGKVIPEEIDRDVDRLVAYYHSLGFFRVRVGREVIFTESDAWADVTFYIEEGPRYSVRDVHFTGNHRYSVDQLTGQLELVPGDHFLRSDLEGDLSRIRDLYGSQGFVFADIQPEVQFLEEPGQVDLVFDIQEGDQYRVGDIHIHMTGTYGGPAITSERTVYNRLDLQPGDILDTRLLEASKRRLMYSELFQSNPAQGQVPTISVRPPELQETDGRQMAASEGFPVYRAQDDPVDRTSPWQPIPLPSETAPPPTVPNMTPTSWYQSR